MNNKNRFSKGASLLEIIIAIAVLSIVVVSLLSIFSFSISGIIGSGNRSKTLMDVQNIVDDLQTGNDNSILNSELEIEAYLIAKGYNMVEDIDELNVRDGTIDVNFFVETKTINVDGFEVTIAKFFNNGKSAVRLTTFVIRR